MPRMSEYCDKKTGQKRIPQHQISKKPKIKMTLVPLVNSMDLQLRFLSPSDLDQVKILCKEWFPIEYPDTWYQEITANPRFYALAATLQGRIIGLIVAETKELGQLAKEDRSILANCFQKGTKVTYILSLGVCKEFRKQGIASLMLENLISHLTSDPVSNSVRAVYLHVLTTNTQAIIFYEHRGFQVHSFLPYYYAIKGRRRDGYTAVLYLNGGHPTWGALDYVKLAALTLCSFSPRSVFNDVCRKLNLAWLGWAAPRLRQVAQSSTAFFT